MPRMYKIIWAIIILLILMNAGILAYLYLQEKPEPSQKPLSPPFVMIEQGVGMNDTQKSEYQRLREEHHEQVVALRAQMAKIRLALYHSATPQANDSLLTIVGNLQKNTDSITYIHFMNVRRMLDEQQKKKFDQILPGIVQQMLMPQRRPPHDMPPPDRGNDMPPPPPGH